MKFRFLLLAFVLVACGPSQSQIETAIAETEAAKPTATPTEPVISEALQKQITKVLEEGSALYSMTAQGVNYIDFQNQLGKTRGAFDLAEADWESDFAPDSRENLRQAFIGWGLTLDLWSVKINSAGYVMEPDVHGYTQYINYAGDQLVIERFNNVFPIESYRDKHYLPVEENISVLFSVAGGYFKSARTELLALMP